jgi:hypothetical protein
MTPRASLRRHASGDWSELFPEDTKENESSPRHGFRFLSWLPIEDRATVWIVTERDGSTTTSTDVPGWLRWHHTRGVKVTPPNPKAGGRRIGSLGERQSTAPGMAQSSS